MIILGDKGCKKFRATEEIEVLSFSSATGVPRDLGQITSPMLSILLSHA